MWTSLSSTLDTLLALQDAMERAGRTEYFGSSTTSAGGYPLVNIFDKDGDYVVVAELPGIKKEDLNLEVKENLLRLAGERKIEYGKEVSGHRIERRPYRFDRTLKLPFRVDQNKIRAEYNNGLLAISLPRAESDKPKQIAIN
ncbi:Hsp20/alpha crystallin family protein [Deltaproteobacteria bacterium TL4]